MSHAARKITFRTALILTTALALNAAPAMAQSLDVPLGANYIAPGDFSSGNYAGGTIEGTLTNDTTIENFVGELTIAFPGEFINDSNGIFLNSDRVYNQGTFTNNLLAEASNAGYFSNSYVIDNDGEFANAYGGAGSRFVNTSTGTINNANAFYNRVNATFDNNGAFNTTGTTQNQMGGIFNNNSNINILAGSFSNLGTLNLAELSLVTNDGVLSNSSAGTINNAGYIINNNTFVNEGVYNIGTGGTSGDMSGNVNNIGTININRSNNYTFSLDITNNGAVNKLGAGTTYVTVAQSSYGNWTVQEGTLALVASSLNNADSITVYDGATFAGNGTASDVTVQSGGTLRPSDEFSMPYTGTLDMDTLTLESGSTLSISVNSSGQNSQVTAIDADITGAHLVITSLDPKAFYTVGNTYSYEVLDTAHGYDGTFADATSPSAFFSVVARYQGSSAYADVTVLEDDLSTVANTPNQRAAANALNTLPQSGDTLALYNALLGLSADDASAAFDQLSGEGHASIQTGFLQDTGAVRGVMNVRLHTPGGNASSSKQGVQLASLGDDWASFVPVEQGALSYWSNLFGSWGNNRANGNAGKVENRTGGLLFGADYNHPTDDWMSGVMFGYSRTNFDVDSRASSGDSDNYHLGVYGAKAWDALTVRGGVSYTRHETDTRRDVVVGGFTDTLRADYGTDSAQAFAELGYTLDAKYAVVEPYFNLTHVNLDTPGYSEEGGGSLLNVAKTSSDTSYTTLGIRASRPFEDKAAKGLVSAGLGWQHAIGDKNSTTSMSFNGSSSFAVSGTPIATDVAVVEFGAALELTDSANLGVSYQGQFGEDYTQNSVVGKLGFTF